MKRYPSNKIRTAYQLFREFKNWPTAWAYKIFRHDGLITLHFRNGLKLAFRGRADDDLIVTEMVFGGSYRKILAQIRQVREAIVIDCGGCIGLFSLLAAAANPDARVTAYEPGPDNYRLFEMNLALNPELAKRIELRKRAVSGVSGKALWHFCAERAGSSSLFAAGQNGVEVEVESFASVVAGLGRPGLIVKLDAEGVEYSIVRQTPAETWRAVAVVSMEIHDDPEGKMSQNQLIEAMTANGYRVEEESIWTHLFERG